ncbi:bifunctional tRNA (5-methylaminomethyl-2-thiouridine)(34)-methyltransferase MnmD/FAD-dependent 5-carboxymethylaminomethyl-2-thiouridine(34) oxidoreductase MnmC [Aestuariirhabdus sp. LZHN29]|uniref:bifunctional tRNA (5-methylaminomethyl-2-thiouridine)(34)-methyltransferase MnmD/FAD-dependent 5-carboxymethylaminomethyl-2-thiouridine(34) oxidoreductase MnmC n=1 Tax=Aestuariirhabdus sp. LZHN29 TaxID=3417462 RepID=UPI003CF6A577
MSSPRSSDADHANLTWDDEGQPRCPRFNDFFFSSDSGIDESRYVFLQQNQLAKRFKRLGTGDRFTIAETGFGTGLNFLCCWHLWKQQAAPDARLHFISTEKYPINSKDLTRALALWPELESMAQPLLQAYPLALSGTHRMIFDDGRVNLTLCIGDAVTSLQGFDAHIDCWFLDGFSPAKNPDIWQPRLFQSMADMSSAGATFATFTSASSVRKGLLAAGFHIEKIPGFGIKREMLRGYLKEPSVQKTPHKHTQTEQPWQRFPVATGKCREIVIVGAGLAGCCSALAMARRGWKVRVLERRDAPALEASGNPQGVLYSKLSAQGTELSELVHQGAHFSLGLLHSLLPPHHNPSVWSPCGVIQLAHNQKELTRQQQLLECGLYHPEFLSGKDAQSLSQLCGVELGSGGLLFPTTGWVNPPSLCKALLDHPLIELTTNWTLQTAQQLDPTSGWRLTNQEGKTIHTEQLVLTTGRDCNTLPQSQYLPLKSIRGQISYLPATTQSEALKSVICAEGYIAPARNGQLNIGATFNFDCDLTSCREKDHRYNLELLQKISPQLYRGLDAAVEKVSGGRANFRTTTPDYLPLIGPLVDSVQFVQRYARLRKDANTRFDHPCPYLPGFYINTAHGSRGLVTCPLGGEILASIICNDPLPITRRLRNAINPSRFLVRQLIRKQI